MKKTEFKTYSSSTMRDNWDLSVSQTIILMLKNLNEYPIKRLHQVHFRFQRNIFSSSLYIIQVIWIMAYLWIFVCSDTSSKWSRSCTYSTYFVFITALLRNHSHTVTLYLCLKMFKIIIIVQVNFGSILKINRNYGYCCIGKMINH